jgi:hypothetical protein
MAQYEKAKLKHMRKMDKYLRDLSAWGPYDSGDFGDSDDSDDSDEAYQRDFWNCPGTVADAIWEAYEANLC